MLRKLLKYDIRYCSSWFLMCYAALLLFALIGRGLLALGSISQWMVIPYALFTVLFYLIAACVAVMTLIIPSVHFYKSLLRDEGYLSFTLPVTPMELVWSKILTGCLFMAATVLVEICAFTIQYIGTEFWDSINGIVKQIFNTIGTWNLISVIAVFLAYAIISCFYSFIMIDSCFAIGQLSNNHKLLSSFLAYLGISMGMQIINSIASMFLSLNMVKTLPGITAESTGEEIELGIRFFNTYLGVFGGIILIAGIGLYFLLRHIMTKKLNLE